MIKNIFKVASSLAFTLILSSSIFLIGTNPVFAIQTGSDVKDDNSIDIAMEESNDALERTKTSAIPDLGDDQAFPFIPGFGKNSGKD